jgi:hypothetical protein
VLERADAELTRDESVVPLAGSLEQHRSQRHADK